MLHRAPSGPDQGPDLDRLIRSCLGPAISQFQEDFRRIRGALAEAIHALAEKVECLEPGGELPLIAHQAVRDPELDSAPEPAFDTSPVEPVVAATPEEPFALDLPEVPVVETSIAAASEAEPEPALEVQDAPKTAARQTQLASGDHLTLRLESHRQTGLAAPTENEQSEPPKARGHHEPVSQLTGHLFAEAQEQHRQGKHAEALARYKEVIKLDPLFVPAYRERGQLLRTLGKHEQALADLQFACELDPAHADSYLRRGNVMVDLGRLDEAIADYGRAIERAPRQAVYYLNRGLAHARRQAFTEVIADGDQALALDPELPDAYFIRGFALQRRHRADEALADYNRLLELAPHNALAWNERGLVHASCGRYAEAIRDYIQALKLNPKLLLARYNRGIAYRLKGDYEMAIADFSEILLRKPKSHQASMNRGMCHFARADYDRALPDFARAAELAPENKEIAARLAEVRAALKEQHQQRAKGGRMLRLSARREQPSREVTVECLECGAQGNINWERLDYLFQCKGCGEVYRIDNCGKLMPVDNVEKFAGKAPKTMPALPVVKVPAVMPHQAAQPMKPATPKLRFQVRRPRLFGIRGLGRRHVAAALLLVGMLGPISFVYGLRQPPQKYWTRSGVSQLCRLFEHEPARAADFNDTAAEVCGFVQSSATGESDAVVIGSADEGEKVVCQIDGYALSTKKQLPRVRAGSFVIVRGTLAGAGQGAVRLTGVLILFVEETPPPQRRLAACHVFVKAVLERPRATDGL